jgi:hypothetical protein
MYRIAVLSTLALPLLGSCGKPARPADDPESSTVQPPADAASHALQDEALPVTGDSAAGSQPAGEQVQPGTAGQGKSVYPLLWDRHEVPPPPTLNVPSYEAPPAPPRAKPRLTPAWPAPARARTRQPPPADTVAADTVAADTVAADTVAADTAAADTVAADSLAAGSLAAGSLAKESSRA